MFTRTHAAAVAAILLLFCTLAAGCGSQSPTAFDAAAPAAGELNRDSSAVIIVPDEGECIDFKQGVFETMGLYTGPNNKQVGTVTMAVTGENLVVIITTSGNNNLSETHLYLGQSAPTTHSPGLFTYQHKNLSGKTDTYTIPLATVNGKPEDHLYLAISAVVGSGSGGGNTATAWDAECRKIFPDHAWKSYCDFNLPPCEFSSQMPSGTSATYQGSGKIHLSWNPMPGATAYQIWRATAEGGPYTAVGSTSNTFFIDTVPGPGTYWYKIRGANSSGVSAFSITFSAAATSGPVLSAPTNVGGNYENGKVHLTWSAVAGAVGYQIFRSTAQAGTYTAIGSTTNTWFDDTIGPGSYWYKIRTVNGDGATGAFSAAFGVVVPQPALSAPANVDGAFSNGQVHLIWDAVSGAAGYQIFRSTSQNGPYTAIGSTTGTSFDDTIGPGSYWYKIRAVDGSNNPGTFTQPFGVIVPAGLTAPLNVQATDGTYPDHIAISWTPVTGATGYRVYRALSQNGTYTLVATTSQTSLNHTSGNTYVYWYKVSAVDGSGEGPQSAADSGYASVAAPSMVRASDGTFSNKIQVTWMAVPGAVSYRVYRSVSQNGTYQFVATTTGTSYDDFVTDNAVYWYRLTTVAPQGESYRSQEDSGFRQ